MKNENLCEQPSHCSTRLWLTSEVASALRVHNETVRRAIRGGRIKAQKVGRTWRVSNDEAEKLIREGLEGNIHKALGPLQRHANQDYE